MIDLGINTLSRATKRVMRWSLISLRSRLSRAVLSSAPSRPASQTSALTWCAHQSGVVPARLVSSGENDAERQRVTPTVVRIGRLRIPPRFAHPDIHGTHRFTARPRPLTALADTATPIPLCVKDATASTDNTRVKGRTASRTWQSINGGGRTCDCMIAAAQADTGQFMLDFPVTAVPRAAFVRCVQTQCTRVPKQFNSVRRQGQVATTAKRESRQAIPAQ